jgi:hypothetical protein
MTYIGSSILYVVGGCTTKYICIYMAIHYIWLEIYCIYFVAINAVDFFDETLRAEIGQWVDQHKAHDECTKIPEGEL